MNRAIEWMAGNRVAANLLMAVIVVGGAVTLMTVHLEIAPDLSLDMISISAVYPGAAPAEVEEGVCLRLEEAIHGLDGIKRITSNAREGSGAVTVELELGADPRKALDEIKARVDAIATFPAETEKPVVQEVTSRTQMVNVAVYSATGSPEPDEATLKHLGEQVRDEIAALPGISLVTLSAARPYEIAIEVSEDDLRRYGLSFDQVADRVRRSSLDLPGGSLKTGAGEILLRTKGQVYRGPEFENLVLMTRPDGTQLRLGDVATVVDGFADSDRIVRFDGRPAVLVEVYRSGEQDALQIARQVERYVEETAARMPEGIRLAIWQDWSELLDSRLSLLLRNLAAGFVLVFISLALFLRLRLAFWVSVGIPISFMGAIWLMPALGLTINVISLFAFIVVLGIVVDDAIIVGESIFTQQQENGGGVGAAVRGVREVSRPVIFAVLTTMAAFAPLFAIKGPMGKFLAAVPLVVIACLLFSLVESLFILPAHLSHKSNPAPCPSDRSDCGDRRRGSSNGHAKRTRCWQGGVGPRKPGRRPGLLGAGLAWFTDKVYRPSLEIGLTWRYATLALGVTTLLLTLGLVGGGYIGFEFMPEVESDIISAAVSLPEGTPVEVTSAAVARLEASAEQVRRELAAEAGEDLFRHALSAVGEQPWLAMRNGQPLAGRQNAPHLGEVTIELTSAENRSLPSDEIARRWRQATGLIPDALELTFSASMLAGGADLDVQLTGPNLDDLRAASAELKTRLTAYAGVYEASDSFRAGRREVELGIKPAAELAGMTLADLGRQVRQAFYGEEVQRIQRGRDELRVMVRYPAAQRRSLGDLENMRIRLPDGLAVPFSEVATVEPRLGLAAIQRVDRRRAIHVTADVDTAVASVDSIVRDLERRVLPEIVSSYPSMQASFAGVQAQQRDSMSGLGWGFLLALLAMYALLAVPLRSYAQPLVIMLAIPFGLVGATWGHVIMGMPLTFLSMFGLVALAGVVVNDSLVMVDFINRGVESGHGLLAAVRQAGVVRFRPILLTSVTTFLGLTPLLLEKSMQARFLIPMAVSLAFGVMFATFITLILVPAGYLVLEDLKALPGRLIGRAWEGRPRLRGETGEVGGPALS